MNHKGTVRLETERLVLRRFVLDDAPAMFANWTNDEDVTRFLTWPVHVTVGVTEAVVRAGCRSTVSQTSTSGPSSCANWASRLAPLAWLSCWKRSDRPRLATALARAGGVKASRAKPSPRSSTTCLPRWEPCASVPSTTRATPIPAGSCYIAA